MNPETLLEPENLTSDSEKESDPESDKLIETTKKFFGNDAIIEAYPAKEVVLLTVSSEISVNAENQDRVALQVVGGYRKEFPDHFIITRGTIEYKGNTFSLSQILPEEAELYLSGDGNKVITYTDGFIVVNVESLQSVESLFTLFHELGHIHDNKKNPDREKINCNDDQRIGSKDFLTQYKPDKAESLLVSRAESERGAWAQGFAMAKKLGLPLETRKEMMRHASECLSTYDVGIALSRFNQGKRYATSELQRDSRKPEKQELKRFLDETVDRLDVIESKIRAHTGKNRENINIESVTSSDKMRDYAVTLINRDSIWDSISMTQRITDGFEHSFFIVDRGEITAFKRISTLKDGQWERTVVVDSNLSFVRDKSIDLQDLEDVKKVVNEILGNLEGKDSDVIDVIIVHDENFPSKQNVNI